MPEPDKDVYTIDEVAKMLRVSDRTIRNLIDEGKLEAFRVGNQWRITREAFERFTKHKQ